MRAEDAMDRALHGTWVGIEADERAMLANALWAVNGGSPGRYGNLLLRLAQPDQLQLAHHWGLALRLGQRLCAGVPELLTQARLELDSGQKSAGKAATLWLSLPEDQAMLYGKPVQRRHQALARALAVQAELRLHSGASSAPTRPTARSAAS